MTLTLRRQTGDGWVLEYPTKYAGPQVIAIMGCDMLWVHGEKFYFAAQDMEVGDSREVELKGVFK